ncbi:MAG: hypothetical protein KC502_02770 [Myxococcales bacterium]|nr:hypothetical protein [Myxococcales bacterium]
MAVLVSEGRPTATQRRRVDGRLSFSALASADAVLIGEQAASCYDIAHLLFCRWHDQYGDRKFTALCRQMRLGNGFDRGFGQVCGLSMADWLQTTIGDLRSELTDELS